MKEIKEIVAAYHRAVSRSLEVALATVVHVEGSSYRRPGARMLITEEGEITGAISGGCLEGDALRKAQYVISRKRSMLVTYDTMDEDDARFGIGLGCNGIIQVLIEPIDPTARLHPIHFLEALADNRQKAVLVTLFSLHNKQEQQVGTCMLIREDGSQLGSAPLMQEQVIRDSEDVLRNCTSIFRQYISESHRITTFLEAIVPPIAMVIIGAGNDVVPLVEFANILGWDTIVVDGRKQYATPERFAPGCQVMVTDVEKILDKVRVDDQTVFLLMTHNYNYDLNVLRELLTRNIVYTGILGPRKKFDRMLEDLRAEGIELSEQQLKNIHTPVGLDIGAGNAEEIALSIVAEVKAVLSNRTGSALRNNADTIHSRESTKIEDIHINPLTPQKNG